MQGLVWITLLVVGMGAVVWQQRRYLRWRRDAAADRQPLLHSPSAFHVVTVLAQADGQELLPALKAFVDVIEEAGAKVVYVGKIAANALHSVQIPEAEWDAFVLAQYPSREAYAASETNTRFQRVRSSFADSYSLGLQRSAWFNLAVPVVLLAMRAIDIVKRHPARYPFRPAARFEPLAGAELAERALVVEGLLANQADGKEACVVLNFIKEGTREQRRANSGYGSEIAGLLAEIGTGPMHIGKAVTLEGEARFDKIVIVFFPGVEFFAEMIQSEFFRRISGNKQLGDTLLSPTVPLLPQL